MSSFETIECNRLEIVRAYAFWECESLESIDLPSARIVEEGAFEGCDVLRDVKFGMSLDSLKALVFKDCPSLERITIPLKIGLFGNGNVFANCHNFKRVDLVEDAIIHKVVDALFMKEWRQDMSNVIDSINQILPNTPAGRSNNNVGGKTRAMKEWIQRVLRSIHHYKGQHRSLLNEAAAILKLDLPSDIVHNNVLAFFELPLHTFDG